MHHPFYRLHPNIHICTKVMDLDLKRNQCISMHSNFGEMSELNAFFPFLFYLLLSNATQKREVEQERDLVAVSLLSKFSRAYRYRVWVGRQQNERTGVN